MNNEEESEFDKDDEGEDCGHTSEEHAKLNGRADRLLENMKKFLAENAQDMLEDGQYDKLVKKIEKRLRTQDINPSLNNLKTFREGFEFGMVIHVNVGSQVVPVFAGISKMITDMEKKSKPVIDITKSMPMPPKNEEEGH